MRIEECYGSVWIHGNFMERQAVADWCTETFGIGGHNPKRRWRLGSQAQHKNRHSTSSVLLFKHDADKIMFMLRWKS